MFLSCSIIKIRFLFCLQLELFLPCLSYHINYEKEGIHNPKSAEEMLPFLTQTEVKIAPILNDELKSVLIGLKDSYSHLFMNKEVILIALLSS